MEAVTAPASLPDNTVAVFRDLHLFLQDPNPVLVRALKDALVHAKTKGKCLVLVGCRRVLPPELEPPPQPARAAESIMVQANRMASVLFFMFYLFS